MVEIRGKRGRKVAIILTQDMKESIDLLNQTRAQVGIPHANKYVFARPTKQSLGHIRACDSLKRFAKECEPPLSNPQYVTSTKLRKYIATISQVLALKETEVDWLARVHHRNSESQQVVARGGFRSCWVLGWQKSFRDQHRW